MPTPEKLCLKWNDFQENIRNVLGDMREDDYFADVTLACEDGEQVEAHKFILAASSPFFHNLFRRNKHAHPLIYMRGMKSEDLSSVVDFLYYGQANIYQDNLDIFFNIAEELSLKGLQREANYENMYPKIQISTQPSSDKSNRKRKIRISKLNHTSVIRPSVLVKNEEGVEEDLSNTSKLNHTSVIRPSVLFKNEEGVEEDLSTIFVPEGETVSDNAMTIIAQPFNTDLQELNEKIKSLIKLGQTMWKNGKRKNHACKVCGKEGQYSLIKSHIKGNHMEGLR